MGKKEKPEDEPEEEEPERIRQFSISTMNESVSAMSSYESDSLKQLKADVIELLKIAKGIDKKNGRKEYE